MCMHRCLYLCVCVCVPAYVSTAMYMFVYVHMCLHLYVCMYMHVYVLCASVYVCQCVCVCVMCMCKYKRHQVYCLTLLHLIPLRQSHLKLHWCPASPSNPLVSVLVPHWRYCVHSHAQL